MTRVSLAPRDFQISGVKAGIFLNVSGPRAVLGGQTEPEIAAPIVPSANSLFGPRGACLASAGGPLFVCDTGHHRLLVWNRTPRHDNAPADLVIGQQGFDKEGRNAKRSVGAATLNVPTAVAFGGGVLAIADAWNHRVLLWHGAPTRHNQPADVVLGQEDFVSSKVNRGGCVAANTLNWCYGVMIADGHLFVADTGNRRMLMWNEIPQSNGVCADLVLGQRDFVTRDENAGGAVNARGMRWPHGIATKSGGLFLTDAGNNRVMVWTALPRSNGSECNFVLGQMGFGSGDHNRAAYNPDAASLNMPYGMTAIGDRLIVADTANSRLLAYRGTGLGMGADAKYLAGQLAFDKKGDNRWIGPVRDSLCWPYSVAACDDLLVVADSGNNRVLLWELVP